MGSRYLTDLADVVRGAGLTCHEESGWQTRARGSGGYNSGLPNHVMIHHTASGASSDGQPDVSYIAYGSGDAPLSNLYLSRSGECWVIAAGATNTNGSGADPCGTIANDSMNSSAIGIEAGNNGTGEPWPQAQQEAYTRLVRALCDHYAIPTGRVHSHAEWAPSRKIDPAGPSRWAGSGTWNEDAFRGDVATGWPGGSPTPPTNERKWLAMYGLYFEDGTRSYWASDMMTTRWLQTSTALNHYTAMLTLFGFNGDPAKAAHIAQADIVSGMLGQIVGPMPWDANRADATANAVWSHPAVSIVGAAPSVVRAVDMLGCINNDAYWSHVNTNPAGREAPPLPETFETPPPPEEVKPERAAG